MSECLTDCASPDGDDICIITDRVKLRSVCKRLLGRSYNLGRAIIFGCDLKGRLIRGAYSPRGFTPSTLA